MKYNIKKVSAINWNDVEKAYIKNYRWEDGGYEPETFAQAVVYNGGIAAKMTCFESNPKATYKNFYDDVYKDSCMEFFFAMEKGGTYMNCEMNSLGTCLIGVGKERNNRTKLNAITDVPEIIAVVGDGVWTVEVFFSKELLEAVFGKFTLERRKVIYGNFYKCGDETAVPHYGMWSLVDVEKPDFHRPEFFGELVIGG